MAQPPIEVEMKLIAANAEALRALPAALRELCSAVKPLGRQAIYDRYFDTADWRFYRANYALRVRCVGGKRLLTMKSLHRPQGGVSRREEWEQTLPKGWRSFKRLSGGPVAARVRRIAATAPVRRLFAIRNRRRLFKCRFDDSVDVMVSADDFRVESASRRSDFAEVELEMVSGDLSELRRFGRLLARRVGLSRRHRAKFRTGLDLAELNPPRRRG